MSNGTEDQEALLTKVVSSFSPMGAAMSYAVDGIDFGLGGNGGPECAASLPWTRRLAEDALAIACSSAALVAGIKMHKPPPKRDSMKKVRTHEYGAGRIVLLVLLAFAYGMEVRLRAYLDHVTQPCAIRHMTI